MRRMISARPNGYLMTMVNCNSPDGSPIPATRRFASSGDETTRIYGCTVFETCNPLRYDDVTGTLYVDSNQRSLGSSRLVALEFVPLEKKWFDEDPEHEVDLDDALFSKRSARSLRPFIRGIKVRDTFGMMRRSRRISICCGIDFREELSGLVAARESGLAPDRGIRHRAGEAFTFDRHSRRLTFQYREVFRASARPSPALTDSLSLRGWPRDPRRI